MSTCTRDRVNKQETMESILAILTSHWNIVLYLVCGLAMLLLIVSKTELPAVVTGRCASPSCARCHGEVEIKKKLLRRLEEHVSEDGNVQPRDISAYLSKNYERVLSAIDSYDRKTEILGSIYRESGFEDIPLDYLSHVWMVPGLKRSPLWSAQDHAAMERLFSVFEDPETFEAVMQEHEVVSKLEEGWKSNVIPTGSWKTYFLMNQGSWVQENSIRCPQTVHLLESSGCLMRGSVFGNVLFSSLKPGSRIEPHTSPCNFRLRCHLALAASSGFSIRVGKCTATWQTGQLLVFDDSYVHTVWHDSERHRETENSNDERERIVLIFDIWHPDINQSEQQALKYIFE